MKKALLIRIPEPCHEDWGKMNPVEKGKFCNSCEKVVVDFTSKTDEELITFLSKNKNTCGRVKKSQLNRPMKLERKSGQSFAPLAASMLLPLTLLSNNPKSENSPFSEKPMVSLGIGRFGVSNLERIQIVTTGKVMDQHGNPLQNVEVKSNETEAREWTNKNGEYRIITWNNEKLVFSKDNFEEQQIRLTNKSQKVNMVLYAMSQTVTVTVGRIAISPENLNHKDSLSVKTSGTVMDDTGLPLPGVNVIIKGTTTGTQTDVDGNYSINAKPGQVLAFSYVGFETQKITISNISNTMDIQMLSNDQYLGGLIVVSGMVSWEEIPPQKDADWYEKSKAAYKNTLEFNRIKKERKKAEKELNKEKRNRQ